MRVLFWLKVNIENAMTRLGPMCTRCCVRNITYIAVTSGVHTQHKQTHTHTHTHTHTPLSVHGNDDYKILRDFNIQADKVIECRLPDIACINKQKRECQIIAFANPGDQDIAIR